MDKKQIVNIHKRPDGIFEIETFEKPLRTQIAELEQENKQLKEQLAEKDRKINKLSKEHFEIFGDMKDYKNLWLAEQRKVEELENKLEYCSNDKWYIDLDKLNISNEIAIKIRKQVCDEIFKELQENTDCYFEERKCNSPYSQLPYIWFNEIRFRKFLDKIEQAKEQLK